MNNGKIVTMVVGSKVYNCPRKMALQTIELAKQKYEKENVNAIVAVEKNGIISLHKDVYDSAEKMLEEVVTWMKGKYSVYYVTKKG